MSYDVIVVGAGIGGLMTAAILASRGVDVCLYERNEFVGGCAANFEYTGFEFEPTAGLYAGWGRGEIYERIFAELKIEPPAVRPVSPAYVVRLSDHTDVVVTAEVGQFEHNLTQAFPECSDAALAFYRDLAANRATLNTPATRFREFLDIQLQMFARCSIDDCDAAGVADTLLAPRRGLYAILGGAQSLANLLADYIRRNGGTIKLNAPVLRLAFASDGQPNGVDLLSGERVTATRAIVSNLTVWDTYGKLVGLNRTPIEVRTRMKALRGPGAYLMFLAMDEVAAARLPIQHLLAARPNDSKAFIFAAAPDWDPRAPDGKRAVTVCSFTDAEEWFTFHADNTETEERDQQTLETWWAAIHARMPELGDGIEVIETATPRTYYERARRKLGMGGPPPQGSPFQSHRTRFPNLFMVGDTVAGATDMSTVSGSALLLVNSLSPK